MEQFFGPIVLLTSKTAIELYEDVKSLPIIDYHCHLNEKDIQADKQFSDIGELWLGGDHYKWRAMRLCGVEEKYITGDADYHEKFMAYARIFPLLCGSPLYYWSQMELALLFDIHEALGPETAERIWKTANEKLAGMRVSDILKQFNVQYIATTDDPLSPLSAHGDYGMTKVRPSFRPDRFLTLDKTALSELEAVTGIRTDTVDGFMSAMECRLNYFTAHGCQITDHGMDSLPVADIGTNEAERLYAKKDELTPEETNALSSHLLYRLAKLYTEKKLVMQIHFATFRNVNTTAFSSVGRDAGYDIMRGQVDTDRMVHFLNTLHERGHLPQTVLYSLNPACVPALATLSGAFPHVRIGAAWWFNDTVQGIRKQLETVAEYAVLGTNLGMLTDSRSFAAYVRFDFFRRILADIVGGYVERGEYAYEHACRLMYQICYGNIKELLKL